MDEASRLNFSGTSGYYSAGQQQNQSYSYSQSQAGRTASSGQYQLPASNPSGQQYGYPGFQQRNQYEGQGAGSLGTSAAESGWYGAEGTHQSNAAQSGMGSGRYLYNTGASRLNGLAQVSTTGTESNRMAQEYNNSSIYQAYPSTGRGSQGQQSSHPLGYGLVQASSSSYQNNPSTVRPQTQISEPNRHQRAVSGQPRIHSPAQTYQSPARHSPAVQQSSVRQEQSSGHQPPAYAPKRDNPQHAYVNPSQVYDDSFEVQRQARRAEEEAARRRQAEEARRDMEAERPRKSVQPEVPGETDLEKQMREMFARMRELNQKDPALLSKLWQEERDRHVATEKAKPDEQPSIPAKEDQSRKKAKRKSAPKDKPTDPNATASTSQGQAREQAKESVTATGKSTSAEKTKKTKKKNDNPPGPISNPTETLQPSAPGASTKPVDVATSKPSDTSRPSIDTNAEVSQQKGDTIWPAEGKQALAAAAVNLLKASNPGKAVSTEEIVTLLDSNPSYIQLCEIYEARDFKLDRSRFAKALLAAVRESRNTPQPSHTNASQSAPPSRPQQAAAAPAAHMQANHQQPSQLTSHITGSLSGNNSQGHVNPVDPSLEGLDAVKEFLHSNTQEQHPLIAATKRPLPPKRSSGQGATAKQKKDPEPSEPQTKEDMARKRTFNDLVDLTQLSSDEEPLPFPPPKRHEGENAEEVRQLPTPPHTAPAFAPSSTVPAIPHQNNSVKGPRPPPGMEPTPGPGLSSSVPQTSQVNVPHFAQHQQTMKPHTTEYQHKLPPLPLDHPARRVAMVQPLSRYKAIRRSKYAVRTIARDVLLACGRHPEMRRLNAHLESLKAAFPGVDDKSDLSSFRWDIVDPGGPPVGSAADRMHPHQDFMGFAEDADEGFEGDEESENEGPPGQAPVAVMTQPLVSAGASTSVIGGPVLPLSKKVGRPRFKNPPFKVKPSASSDSPRITPSTSTPVQKPNEKALTYSELRAKQAASGDPDAPKKRGRPVGWRKWMQQTPSDLGNSGSTSRPKKGPKPKRKSPSPPQPKYQVYKCEWETCHAELHNLNALRKHVHKIHGRKAANGMYICLWHMCRRQIAAGQPNGLNRSSVEEGQVPRWEFYEEPAWKEHVEKKHIEHVAWEKGDGPADGLSSHEDTDLSEAYFSDAQGRRVTPVLNIPREGEDEQAGGDHNEIQGRENRATAIVSAAESEALAEQRRMEKRRRDLGIGIDRGGATLANPKRRMGFIDDEEDVVVVDE